MVLSFDLSLWCIRIHQLAARIRAVHCVQWCRVTLYTSIPRILSIIGEMYWVSVACFSTTDRLKMASQATSIFAAEIELHLAIGCEDDDYMKPAYFNHRSLLLLFIWCKCLQRGLSCPISVKCTKAAKAKYRRRTSGLLVLCISSASIILPFIIHNYNNDRAIEANTIQ